MSLDMSASQFDLVYNALSFTFATMIATTIFCWMRVSSCAERYKGALVITGLVTFIAAYHYLRIFNSWTEAYEWTAEGGLEATGKPFNDAYRYMDWLLTVPLLLIEIILVMKLDAEETFTRAWTLGVSSAAMIVLGYPGELILDESKLGGRWFWWMAAMVPFVYIVNTLLNGLSAATQSESDPKVRDLIKLAQNATVISWCTYPIVYLFPMLGISGSNVVVMIQLGYSVSDIVSKCGVGLIVYSITMAKSKSTDGEEAPLNLKV